MPTQEASLRYSTGDIAVIKIDYNAYAYKISGHLRLFEMAAYYFFAGYECFIPYFI